MTKNKFDLRPWMMLISRSLLFLAFQIIIGLILFDKDLAGFWVESAAWWPIAIILTDVTGLCMLIFLYRQEGKRYWEVFQIKGEHIKKDLLFMLASLVILLPVGFLPNILSAQWLFGDSQVALDLLIRPLPMWAAIFSFIAFPLLQGAVELPTYMLYVMPRLEKQGVRSWMAIALTGFFLSAQHIFAPFMPDLKFITYRFVMFLPFAFLIAIILRRRPRLLPYFAIIHVLMNLSVGVMFLLAV